MASPDVIITSTDRCGDLTLAVNPFVSNRYHFGMLLGVADLEAEQAYHRGKTWLHNAWLHGSGCVWGLEVELTVGPDGASTNELVVRPGLAIDGHGRELYVSDVMCVDVTRWYAERRPEDLEVVDNGDGTIAFPLRVELCHDSCLDRPVPSIAEPCGGGGGDTAYSRAVERGRPRLVPDTEVEPKPEPYRRVRQFLGQLPVDDPLVADALAAVAAADPDDRPAAAVAGFRRMAAADTMARRPEDGAAPWSPVAGDGCVPLARLVVHLRQDGDTLSVVIDGDRASTVDNLIRPSLLPTAAVQELASHLRPAL